MIDWQQIVVNPAFINTLPSDPGRLWTKESAVAIDAPPDQDADPLPEARWSKEAKRTGICGAVSPRVIALPRGGFRLYYTQILPRPGFPAGANDYDNSTTRILSAFSVDGALWMPEAGVRLSSQKGGAGEFRVASSEVVPLDDGVRLRMYYECCTGPQSSTNSIRSAISTDGGLEWTPEAGTRIQLEGHNYSAPRILFLNDDRCRMYYYDRDHGIVSAISTDGLAFQPEPGIRIAQDGIHDSHAAFAPEIFQVADRNGFVMYYAGYSRQNFAQILRATSDDGLTWRKETDPVIVPGPGAWDAAKSSEMCLIRLPSSDRPTPSYRLLYEACDGTATNQRGVWRIASATAGRTQ